MMPKRLSLPEVTLVAATSVAIPATVRALKQCIQQVEFGKALLLSHIKPVQLPGEIEWRQIPRLNSRHRYSTFMLKDLVHHIETSHALCIQWDGYVLNSARWQHTFLNFDYIGARWPQFSDGHDVGNGGFSLRSRRLLHACSISPRITEGVEDLQICRVHRDHLEDAFDIRFAKRDVADQFSFERAPPTGHEFGFHGVFNLLDLADAEEFAMIYGSLEPGLLGRRELRDLLRGTIRKRWLKLAARIGRDMASASFRSRGHAPRLDNEDTSG